MALLPCRECGREISSLAQACPHCGAPLRAPPQQKQPGVGTVAAGTFGGLLGCILAPVAVAILGGVLLMMLGMCAAP